MTRSHDARILRLGAITLTVMALLMAAAFNLSKFPGFGGTSYYAEFSDASGLQVGNTVQVAGIRVGRVQDLSLEGSLVMVKFEVDNGVDFGTQSAASIEVQSLLGDKYLQLRPLGDGQLDPDTPIPLDRTRSAYDIVGVLGDLTTTTEDIDKGQLKRAFDTLATTVDAAAPEIEDSFDGISRLSRTVSSRDAKLQELFRSSKDVTQLLADRGDDLVDLMGSAREVFDEVKKRKQAIHRLLVNARNLAVELRGVADDNQREIGPALQQVDDLLDTLNGKEKEIKATLSAFGPYVSILGNIIGTGPWFDAYAVNLLAIPTGEFLPGQIGG